jgi:hypothetical protein
MHYKYAVTIYFRNGKVLELLSNRVTIQKDPGGVSLVMSIDGDIVIELNEGIGNPFSEGNTTYYNASPRLALYDKFPPDWDPYKENFNLIDKINVDSRGREAEPNSSSRPIVPDPGNCN